MGRMFGTNGIRGVVNKDMNVALALQIGKAVGKEFPGRVAVGTDTRLSADMLTSAVASGLMAVGCDVDLLGMLPTPAIQYYVKTHDDVAAAVVVTASHNPPEFNGLKVIASDGTEASKDEEEAIEDLYDTEIETVPWDKAGRARRVDGADEDYVDAVLSRADVKAIQDAKLTVVLDCANGASCYTSPLLLRKLGVRAIMLNSSPDGTFPGHPSEPTAENLVDLCRTVPEVKADLGIAHDGDADRCVFVDGSGNYVPGDKVLAVLARSMCQKNPGSVVVTPVATSSVIDDAVSAAGGRVVRTAVGSPVVARKMMEVSGIMGGEENGGLIFPDHQYCRDGAMAIVRMLECIIHDGPLEGQVASLPVYYTVKDKIACPNERKKELLKHMEDYAVGELIDKTDGIKVVYSDGWVLMRPSGTEPIFRIYAETKDETKSKAYADRFVQEAVRYLGTAI
jgi:phosphomannomutase/phosphoglucomutase